MAETNNGRFDETSQKNLFITTEEKELFFESITPREDKYGLILSLIACAGCRPCEAVRLNHRDFVNENYTRFYVANYKVAYLYNGVARKDLKMAPDWLGEEIREYIKKYYVGIMWNDGYLFPSDRPMKRKHMNSLSFNAWFGKKRRALGLMDVVGYNAGSGRQEYRVQPYSFRRWFATFLDEQGVSAQEIGKLMGHRRPDITMSYIRQKRSWGLAELAVAKFPPPRERGQIMLRAYVP